MLKSKPLNVILFIVGVYTLESQSFSEETLIFVQVISRHGARSPVATYPKDPYKEGYWEQGLAQLTELGVQQHHELGGFLRGRYVNGHPYSLLKVKYDRREMYVRSSDVDRTLMSAIACMTALYPHNGSVPNPIPVHTVPTYEDQLLYNGNCPEYEKVAEEVMHSDEVESYRLQHVEEFQFLAKHSGHSISSFDDVKDIADNIVCVFANNYTLPPWILYTLHDVQVFGMLKGMLDYYFDIRTNRRNEARLKAGNLLTNLVNKMIKKSQENITAPSEKALFYFTHDDTIASLLSLLGIFNGKSPPFAASVIIELHQINFTDSSKDFFVKILYRNSSEIDPFVLKIPDCNENCSMLQFIALTSPNFVLNWEEECFGKRPKNGDYVVFILGGACVAFLIIAICAIIFAVVRHRSTSIYRKYVDVPTEIE